MSAAELDRKALAALEEIAGAQHLSVILGAGASVPANLPSWNELAVQLLVESTALYGPTPKTAVLEPAILHLAVAGLVAQRPAHEVDLFTLNFDVLLEKALRRLLAEADGGGEVATRSSLAPGAPGHYVVNHLHGVIDPTAGVDGSFEDVVLTLTDFTTLANESGSWQFSDLQRALAAGPMLLAGTSYRDPDLRQWLQKVTSDDRVPQHARVVFLARQGLDLDREQFARVQDALRQQWTSIGIIPVLTHDHADAAQAMWELPWLGQQDYLSPQQRAQSLLAAHQQRFADLQREHTQHLGDSANLTLWLADGQGSLVRWASNDRIYRSPGDLRRVPSGYDSPWVAGQCLSREDVVARELVSDGSTRRWLSVVAAPITVELRGGPGFSAAAISSATPASLDDADTDAWMAALRAVAETWSSRLARVVQ